MHQGWAVNKRTPAPAIWQHQKQQQEVVVANKIERMMPTAANGQLRHLLLS
jgi:hypothetical protein